MALCATTLMIALKGHPQPRFLESVIRGRVIYRDCHLPRCGSIFRDHILHIGEELVHPW